MGFRIPLRGKQSSEIIFNLSNISLLPDNIIALANMWLSKVATIAKQRVLSRLAFSSLTSACFLALGSIP